MDGTLEGYVPYGLRIAVSFSTTQGSKFLSNVPGQNIVGSKLTDGRSDQSTHLEVVQISESSEPQYFALRFVDTGRYVYRNLGLGTLETASNPYYPLNVSYDFELLRPTSPREKSSLDLKGFDHANLRLSDFEQTPIEHVSVKKLRSPQRLSRRPDPPDGEEQEETQCHEMYCTVLCDDELFADTNHSITITTYNEDTDREELHEFSPSGLRRANQVSRWIRFPSCRLKSLRLLKLALEEYEGPLDPLKAARITLIIELSSYHYAICSLDLYEWISDDIWIVMPRPFLRYENCFVSPSNLGISGPQLTRLLDLGVVAAPAVTSSPSQRVLDAPLSHCALTAREAVRQIRDFVARNTPVGDFSFAYTREEWSAHCELDPYTIAARVINMLIAIHYKSSRGIERALEEYFEMNTPSPFLSDLQWQNTRAMLRGRIDPSHRHRDEWPLNLRFHPDRQGQMIGPMPLEVAVLASAAYGDPFDRYDESRRPLVTFFQALLDSHNPLRFAVVVSTAAFGGTRRGFDPTQWHNSRVRPPMNLGPITAWDQVALVNGGGSPCHGVQIVMQAPGRRNAYIIAIHTADQNSILSASNLDLNQINGDATHNCRINRNELNELTFTNATRRFSDHWGRRQPGCNWEYQFAHAHFSTLNIDLSEVNGPVQYQDATIHAVISDGHLKELKPKDERRT